MKRGQTAAVVFLLGSGVVCATQHFRVTATCADAFSPSSGETARITAQADRDWHATVTVFDSAGRLVRVLAAGLAVRRAEEGPQVFEWDGTDRTGKPAAPGRYTIRVEGNSVRPLHTWGEKTDDILSYYYRYGRFDGKDESFFFLSEVSFNETPCVMDSGVPDKVARRFDFDGHPLGEMLYMEGSSSFMSSSFCVDIHDAIYLYGYRQHFDGLPGTLCRYDGRTGRLVWQAESALPEGVDAAGWEEVDDLKDVFCPMCGWLRSGEDFVKIFRGFGRREMKIDGCAAMWDTDSRVRIAAATSRGMKGEWGMLPVYVFDAATGRFLERIELDKRRELCPYPLPSQCREEFIRLTPEGTFIGPFVHYSHTPVVQWDQEGRLVWGLTPHVDIDGDGLLLTPPSVTASNWGESLVLSTSHDLTPMATDIEGNSYYLTNGRFCPEGGEVDPQRGLQGPVVHGVVKYDRNGQFLHASYVGFVAADFDVSADGKRMLTVGGKQMQAAVYGFDYAETSVVVAGEAAKEEAAGRAPEPGFARDPRDAADYYNRGLLYGARKEYVEAHASLRKTVEMSRDADLSACALCYAGKFHEREDRYDEAIECYQRWAEIQPSERDMALLKAADCHEMLGQQDAAADTYRAIADSGADRFWRGKAALRLARHSARQGDAAGAVEAYDRAAAAFPHLRPVGLLEAARLRVRQEAWDRAETDLRELMRYYPLYSETAYEVLEEAYTSRDKKMELSAGALDAVPGRRGDGAADALLGQEDFTGGWYPLGWSRQRVGVPFKNMFDITPWPLGLWSDGERLYGVDRGHGRVGIYRIEGPSQGLQAPSASVGGFLQRKSELQYAESRGLQHRPGGCNLHALEKERRPDFFCDASAVAVAGGRMYVTDHFGCRVLVYEPVPTQHCEAPVAVLGKKDFLYCTPNCGGLDASSMSIVVGVYSDGKRLFVGDTGNHRVLIWNSLPASNGVPADLVLGQKDFTSNERNAGGISASSLNRPSWMCTHGDELVVSDTCNHRVLIWSKVPTKNFAPADMVLGQEGFDVPGAWNMFDSGLVDASSMAFPNQVFSDGGSLYLADSWNNRIMIWDTPLARNNQEADRFIGWPDMRQVDFVRPEVWTMGNPQDMAGYYPGVKPGKESAGTVHFPVGVCADDRNIYVSDYERHRVLAYWK